MHYVMLLPASILMAVAGLGTGSLLVALGEVAAGVLTYVVMIPPIGVVVPLSLAAFRRRRRLDTLLAQGQRVWGRVLQVERGMARMRLRSFRTPPELRGIYLSASVRVEWAPAGGAARVGECRGWFRAAELDALERGAPAPIIGLETYPEVIVGPVPAT